MAPLRGARWNAATTTWRDLPGSRSLEVEDEAVFRFQAVPFLLKKRVKEGAPTARWMGGKSVRAEWAVRLRVVEVPFWERKPVQRAGKNMNSCLGS